MLCTTVVHNDTHTHEQFSKVTVGFWRNRLGRTSTKWTILYRVERKKL